MATAQAPAAARGGIGTCTPAQVAWLALLPCATLTVIAVALLGPPLGDLLFAPEGMIFWPTSLEAVLPEPTEHARFAIALLGPLLLAGCVLRTGRRPPPPAPRALALLVPLVQAALAVFLAWCLYLEHTTAFAPSTGPRIPRRTYFTAPTLVVAGLLALALAAALTRPALLRRAATLLRDTPWRRAAAIAAAVALLAVWMLTAVNSDATIGAAYGIVASGISIWLDEALAVVNGRPPLVHLQAQYAQLWPYLTAGTMTLLGTSVSVFAATMIAGTSAAMLAILALLRRVTRSWLAALALFAPFLATSFFKEAGALDNRYAPSNLFSLFPLRSGGPYVLAWLTVRHLDGAGPRRSAWLLLVGWVVAINNLEFGLPALGATVAALALAQWPLSWAAVGRLARDLLLTLAAAVAVVSLLTLAVAGSLPHYALALTFARMFGAEGFGMLPMRIAGFHLALYATFAAALAAAAVEAVRGRGAAPLTGGLAWAGVFGLGAGAYYAGRSHPDVLICLFSIWALALMLLLVLVVRAAARADGGWRPSPAVLALLAAVGLAVCSLAQTPAPWSQIERLGRTTPPVLHSLRQERAIAAQTRSGEPVALVVPVGHRIAADLGIVDVFPFADARLVAPRQLADAIAALRAAGGSKLIVQEGIVPGEALEDLAAQGFEQQETAAAAAGLLTFLDARGG